MQEISALAMKNFKCFRSQEVELGRLTVLAGKNSAGKSTVIQALLALKQSHDRSVLHAVKLDLNGSLVNLGTGKDVLFVDADSEEIQLGLLWRDGVRFAAAFQYSSDSRTLLGRSVGSDKYEAVRERPPFCIGFQHLRAHRLTPDLVFPMRAAGERANDLGVRGEFVPQFLDEKAWDEFDYPSLVHPGASSGLWTHQVEAWMGELGLDVRLVIEPQSSIDAIRLAYRVDGIECRPANLGFGVTYCLPVVVALLAARAGSLVIIENPETHLHPSAQRGLGRLCALVAGTGAQIVVETHSDHVVNGARIAVKEGKIPAEDVRFNFFMKEKRTVSLVTPRVLPSGQFDGWPEGFFDEWERALSTLVRR